MWVSAWSVEVGGAMSSYENEKDTHGDAFDCAADSSMLTDLLNHWVTPDFVNHA